MDLLNLPPTLTDLTVESLLVTWDPIESRFLHADTEWRHLLLMNLNLRRFSTCDTLSPELAIDVIDKFIPTLTDLTWGAYNDLSSFSFTPTTSPLLCSLTLYTPTPSHLRYFSTMRGLTTLSICEAPTKNNISVSLYLGYLSNWSSISSLTSLSLTHPNTAIPTSVAELYFHPGLRYLSLDIRFGERERVWSLLECCTSLHTLILKEDDIPPLSSSMSKQWTRLFQSIGARLSRLEIPSYLYRGDYLTTVLSHCPHLVDFALTNRK